MRPHPHVPKYRHYKPKHLGLVVIGGKQYYLGRYGSPESLAEYNRLIQQHLTGSPAPAVSQTPPTDPTVNDLILAFSRHAESHYRKPDGSPTGEFDNFRAALRPLRKLYGPTPARDFGPVALIAVREAMVRAGLSRTTVNARVNRIRRAFKWAASLQLVPATVVQALGTVAGLQRGRSKVKESAGVKPVSPGHVEAALPYMPRPVAAMVRLQLLTGCRAGEVTAMRGRDLTPGEPVWEYRPADHKNAWRGQDRVIALGPQAQAVLKGFLGNGRQEYLFRPRDAVVELHARRARQRAAKPTPAELVRPSEAPGRGRSPRYDRRTYRQAIVRACRKAGVPPWTPLQLRHAAATTIRARFGLEAAQTVLGHVKADTTQIYAERDLARARAVMAEIG